MESKTVKTIVLNNEKMFRLSEVVDELWKIDKKIERDGVFVGEFPDEDEGSSLSECLEKLKTNLEAAKKGEGGGPERQYVCAFPTAPGVFGHRAFSFKKPTPGQGDEEDDDVELCLCSQEDIDEFTRTATDETSYTNPTCCTTILESKGQDAVIEHIFNDMKAKATDLKKPKPKSLSATNVAAAKKKYDTFMKTFEKMSSEKKADAAMKMVKADKREKNMFCSCIDDLDDEPVSHEGGVMYASGIPIEPTDDIKLSSQYKMVFMGVTTMNRLLTQHYNGVTRPMIYFGSGHSFAPVHVEDVSLFSINFLHHGHPKLWFVVQPSNVNKLRNCLLDEKTISGHSSCPNGPLGHKYFIPTAKWMDEKKIKYNVIIQRPRQAVVLYRNAAHWVINLGNNCAEASNFPSLMWLPYGLASLKCHCIGTEVHMDLRRMVSALKPEWLDCLKNGLVPKDIKEEENPKFYDRIILACRCTVNAQVDDSVQPVANEGSDEEESEEDEEESEEDAEDLPELPKKRFKMEYKCTLTVCSKIFKGRRKNNLWNHLQTHAHEPNFQECVAEYKAKYEKEAVSKRMPCNLCGKMITAHPSNMKTHQDGKGCNREDN